MNVTYSVKFWAGLAAIALLFLAGFGVRDYMASKQLLAIKLAASQQQNQELANYAAGLKELADRNQKLQATIDTLGIKHTDALNEKLAENDRLRTDLAVARRMRLQGTSCPKADSEMHNPGTGGVGDGTGVELSLETRLLVWDLRAAMLRDQAKVTYLQDYVRSIRATNPE